MPTASFPCVSESKPRTPGMTLLKTPSQLLTAPRATVCWDGHLALHSFIMGSADWHSHPKRPSKQQLHWRFQATRCANAQSVMQIVVCLSRLADCLRLLRG
jgi:hypothetical protein